MELLVPPEEREAALEAPAAAIEELASADAAADAAPEPAPPCDGLCMRLKTVNKISFTKMEVRF